MKTREKPDSVNRNFDVSASAKEAFETFVNHFSSWWPKEYTWSQDALTSIGITPKQNGLCYEKGPYNFRCDWGRVIEFEPPNKIIFTWQISPERVPVPDPEKASIVEIKFDEKNAWNTVISFVHRDFSRHGKSGGHYREVMDSAQGWSYILHQYEKAVSELNAVK